MCHLVRDCHLVEFSQCEYIFLASDVQLQSAVENMAVSAMLNWNLSQLLFGAAP